MPTASYTLIEKQAPSDTVETVTLDGQRYHRLAVAGLSPVKTQIVFTDCMNPAWAWLNDRTGGGLSLDYRLASYPQWGMAPEYPIQWVFEVTDKGLARFVANFGAMRVAA